MPSEGSVELSPPPSEIQAEQKLPDLNQICRRLTEIGYNESSLETVLGAKLIKPLAFGQLAIFNRYLLGRTEPLELCVRLLYFGFPLPRDQLTPLFASEQIDFLIELGILEKSSSDIVCSTVTIYPVRGAYLATDRAFETDDQRRVDPGRVMCLGGDSYALAILGAATRGARVLDLCTGAGVAALVNHRSRQTIRGVDINPRAVAFARFNAHLVGASPECFVQGDLYQPVAGDRFDLILANPPFVPTPALGEMLYRDGGPGGDQVLSKIIAGLPEYLEEGGYCIITANQVEHHGLSYEDKIRRWLDTDEGFQCIMLSTPPMSPYDYALGHHAVTEERRQALDSAMRWIDQYLAEKITGISAGHLLIRRNQSYPWKMVRLPISGDVQLQNESPGFVEEVFSRLDRLEQALRPGRRFRASFQPGETALSREEPTLYDDVKVEYPFVDAMLASDGEVTSDDVLSHLDAHGCEVGAEERADLQESLQELYLLGFLDEL